MRRRWRLWLSLACTLVAVGVVLHPAVYWSLVGWAHGEPFYRGKPASWWAEEARPPTETKKWIVYLSWKIGIREKLGSDVDLDGLLTSGDPSALPVLLALLNHSDANVRWRACWCLAHGDWNGQAACAIPALTVAGRDPDLMVRVQSRLALRAIDPQTSDQANGK